MDKEVKKNRNNLVAAAIEKLYELLKPHLNVESTKYNLRKIHVCSDSELDKLCKKYYIRLISNVVLVLLMFLILTILLMTRAAVVTNQSTVLTREAYGGDITKYDLIASKGGQDTEFEVELDPVYYQAEEMEHIFEQGFTYIEENFLGENESQNNISQNMNLMVEIPELGLQVGWISDDYQSIKSSGEITDEIVDEPRLVTLTAYLTYEDYQAERNYTVRLIGKEYSDEELAIQAVKEYIEELAVEGNSDKITIPENLYGYRISKANSGKRPLVFAMMGIVIAVLIGIKSRADLKSAEDKRNAELTLRYPSFVERLSLYLGAGLNIKGALTVMCDQPDNNSKMPDILTNEIRYALNQLNSGCMETEVYYDLGYRLNLSMYVKITSLLCQNLKKGTNDLLEQMEAEELSALSLRRDQARKKGEEAGTKLLFPMIMLLGVVMIIIMLPAIMSF